MACRVVMVFFAVAFFGHAHAQPTVQKENPTGRDNARVDSLIVTAPRLSGDSTMALTRLTREDIELLNPSDAVDALRNVSGLDILQPAGPGGRTEVFIRGAESNFSIVTFDGVELGDPMDSRGGSFNFSALSVDEIESAEVIRGPISSAFGSDALAGAINIGSRRATPGADRVRFSIEGADDPFVNVYGDAALVNTDRIGVIVGGAYFNADEPTPSAKAEVARARIGFRWSGAGDKSLDLIGHYGRRISEGFPDASGGDRLAVNETLQKDDSRDFLLSARYSQPVTAYWSLEAQASLIDRRAEIRSPGIAPAPDDPFSTIPASQAQNDFRRAKALFVNRLSLSESLRIAFGAEIEQEDGETLGALDFGGFPAPTNFAISRTTLGGFLETRAEIGAFDFFGSMRLDDIDDQDLVLSGRVGAGYQPHQNWRLRASYATGFRAPSFYALGDPIVGNEALAPEEGRTVEVGLEASSRGAKARSEFVVFRSSYERIIDFDFTTFSLVNLSSVVISGAEWSGEIALPGNLRASGSFAYTDYDAPEGTLLGRPKTRGSARLNWAPSSQLRFDLEGIFNGERPSASVPTGFVALPASARIDFGVSYSLPTQGATIIFAVDDALNLAQEEAPGFTPPGRRFRLKLRYALR